MPFATLTIHDYFAGVIDPPIALHSTARPKDPRQSTQLDIKHQPRNPPSKRFASCNFLLHGLRHSLASRPDPALFFFTCRSGSTGILALKHLFRGSLELSFVASAHTPL